MPLGTVNTAVLIGSSVTMVMAYASLKMNEFGRFRFWLAFTIGLSLLFMVIKAFEYNHEFEIGNFPWDEHLPGDLLHDDRVCTRCTSSAAS